MVRHRFRYKVEQFLSRRPGRVFFIITVSFVGGLAVLSMLRIVLSELIGGAELSPGETVWRIWLQATDPGNMNLDEDPLWIIRSITVLTGVFGIVFFSALIAFMAAGLDQLIATLRLGITDVNEKRAILIVGWNHLVYDLLSELIIANESERRAVIIILSELPKIEMDTEIASRFHLPPGLRIITRSGDTGNADVLRRVTAGSAKSIILLHADPDNNDGLFRDLSDALNFRRLLAVRAALADTTDAPVPTCCFFRQPLVDAVRSIIPSPVSIFNPDEFISRIIAQATITPGLSDIYRELTGFHGSEFYFSPGAEQKLPFAELIRYLNDGIPVGFLTKQNDLRLNPRAEEIVPEDATVIILSEDDSTIHWSTSPLWDFHAQIPLDRQSVEKKHHICVIGIGKRLTFFMREILSFLSQDDRLTFLLLFQESSQISAELALDPRISLVEVQSSNLPRLAKKIPEDATSIVLLAQDDVSPVQADSNELMMLAMVRAELNRREKIPSVLCELRDTSSLELVMQTGSNESLVSEQIVSHAMAQAAEDNRIIVLYNALFTNEGMEIYTKPLSAYTSLSSVEVRFIDLFNLALRRGETCIGIRFHDDNTIRINPPKDVTFTLHDCDHLIVIAEDEK